MSTHLGVGGGPLGRPGASASEFWVYWRLVRHSGVPRSVAQRVSAPSRASAFSGAHFHLIFCWRLVVTSVRPHPAFNRAQRACQLHPVTGQACCCCGSVSGAVVRATPLTLRSAACVPRLSPLTDVYAARREAAKLRPAPPLASAGHLSVLGTSTHPFSATVVRRKAPH